MESFFKITWVGVLIAVIAVVIFIDLGEAKKGKHKDAREVKAQALQRDIENGLAPSFIKPRLMDLLHRVSQAENCPECPTKKGCWGSGGKCQRSTTFCNGIIVGVGCTGYDCQCCIPYSNNTSNCSSRRACRWLNGTCMGNCEECLSPNFIRIYSACKGNCFCCAPKKTVKAAFKITNEEYNENLRDLNSGDYKLLKKKVEDSVKSALRKKLSGKGVDYEVEFFRNGSTIIVDGTVTTTGEDSETAHKIVYDALRSLNVSWVDDTSVYVGVRLCVPGQDNRDVQDACAAMKQDISQMGITCVNARDRYDCLKRLTTKEVDVVRADPADVYLAKELPGADFSVIANTRPNEKLDEQYRYLTVAVVRKSTISGLADLKGKKSCHTGYGKICGWKVPLAKLLEKGQLTPHCSQSASVVEIELSAVASYFNKACIPGPWVPDTDINTRLKTTYKNLCELCANPSQCDAEDAHAGHQGALKCLVDNNGDVAWTKYDEVAEFFQSRQSVNQSEFGFLCPDDSIIDLDSDIIDCYWAARPWDAWLTRTSEEDKGSILSTLSNAFDNAVQANSQPKNWGKVLLGINEESAIKDLNPSVSPYDYLNQAGFYTTISIEACEVAPVVCLCVNSDIEEQKCLELAAVLKSRGVLPALNCSRVEDCVAAVTEGTADIVSLDGGDIFKGHKYNKITPIISEVYGKYDATYFAVAVVWNNSGITKLADLQGKKSCHTGIQKTAGWKIPTVTLIEAGLIKKDDCDYVGQVGNFFSESCAPGANLTKYDPEGTNPDSLCNLCVGDPEASDPLASKCNRDSSEAYYSYTGAFRCLVEGGGDVAFVKHTTVIGDTDGNSNHTWNQNLQSSEFRLLCKNNTDAAITDYESCNLAIVPSHKVVTGFNSSDALKEQIKILLLRASETLPLGQDVFNLFGDYGPHHDIIFKSSATSLINLSVDDVNQLLTGTYYTALTELEACEKAQPQV